MRSLGMITIMPAFAGHVPNGITRVFPKANVTHLPPWSGFTGKYCCTAFLQPTDPLFRKIGKMFVDEIQKEFGTDHVYHCDSFIEMDPKSADLQYLTSITSHTFGAMTASDSKAVWLINGWIFYHNADFWKAPQVKAYVTSVPQGRLIVLDLYAEEHPTYNKLDSFFGQPFIWVMLHNFGGSLSMYGDLESINKGPFLARSFPNSTMVGTGIAPEGINQNNVVYEFMLENAYRKQPENLTAWISNYAVRRYGKANDNIIEAWQLLLHSVYNTTDGDEEHGHGRVVLVKRPSLTLKPDIWYDPNLIYKAWDLFVLASNEFKSSDLFRYDLVDVGRQALQLLYAEMYGSMKTSFANKDLKGLQATATNMSFLMNNMDSLLGTSSHFLLGSWIYNAQANGATQAEEDQYELGARAQITIWGPQGQLIDYGNRLWSGLVRDYYAKRWKLFTDYLIKCIQLKQPFNQTFYNGKVWTTVEKPFPILKKEYPHKVVGDSIAMSKKIHDEYRHSVSDENQIKLYPDKGNKIVTYWKQLVIWAKSIFAFNF